MNRKSYIIAVKGKLNKSIRGKALWLLLAVGSSLLTSCNKFLDEEIQGDFSSSTFYQNETQALQALNGAYNAISFTSSNNALWVIGDVASDDAIKGGNAGDQAEITYIDNFTADANNGVVNNYWQFLYEGIARANNVIAYAQKTPMGDDLKARIVGEARFLRAYNYFILVNTWGRVPLKLEPQVTQEAIHVPLSSIEAVYSQIEADLNAAVAVLPIEYTSGDKGRATRGAALGLLGKAQLYQQKWGSAISTFQQLEGLSIYGLLPHYQDVFKLENENSKESVWEIQHLTGKNPKLGSCLNQWFAPSVESGYSFNAPTEGLVSAYEKSTDGTVDPRLDATLGRDGVEWLNGAPFQASWSPSGYLTKKHQQPLTEVSITFKGDGDLDYIYLRYADVLLMKSEAFNEIGNVDSSLANLNKVRTRARNSIAGEIPTDLLNPVIERGQSALRKIIQHERRVELGQEFHRYFDLMRWGKQVAESALGSSFNYETKRYLPIPQAEIDANQAI